MLERYDQHRSPLPTPLQSSLFHQQTSPIPARPSPAQPIELQRLSQILHLSLRIVSTWHSRWSGTPRRPYGWDSYLNASLYVDSDKLPQLVFVSPSKSPRHLQAATFGISTLAGIFSTSRPIHSVDVYWEQKVERSLVTPSPILPR